MKTLSRIPSNEPFKVTPTGLEPIPPEVESTFTQDEQAVLEKFAGIKAQTMQNTVEPTNPTEDPINPSHYRKHPSGIECIEVTRHMNFNIGNAVKYLWRYIDKGDPIENLKKAQWYIDDEIRRLSGLR